MSERASRLQANVDGSAGRLAASRALLFAGVALAVGGFAWHGMWRVLPWERFALSLLLALLAWALGWPLRRFAHWSLASSTALVWVLALVLFAGPAPVIGATALAATALAIGLPWLPPGTPARLAIATTGGLALIAGVGGWALSWPVHHQAVWGLLVLAVLVWQRRVLRNVAASAVREWQSAVASAPCWAGFAVMLLGLASTACWLPTMQVDDLAYHLGLPSQLLMYGEYRPDPAHQVWAFAPWAGDALQGFAAVLSGGDARGGVNALWLGLAAAAIWSAATGAGARPAERWACVALFASLPPLVWMAAGMQTELAATAATASLLAVIVGTGTGRLWAGAVLFAILVALKGVHVLAALPLLAYAGWRHRHALPWRRMPAAILLVAVVGGSSYAFSWWHTGNPVLPLFNGYFESPFFPVENYRDPRWHTGFGPMLGWNLVFDTDRYVEAWDGGLGLSLIALSGAWLAAMLDGRSRALALALAACFLLPLVPMQYARYAYPGLMLLVVAMLPHGQARFGRRTFVWIVVASCMINLALQANASWLHHSSALKRVIRSAGNPAEVFPYYVPERTLLQRIPEDDDGMVLATNPSRAYIAELGGRGRGVLDHDPRLKAARAEAETDPSGARWRALLGEHDIRWVLVTPATASPALQSAVRQIGVRVAAVGDAELWRVDGAGVTR